MRDKPSDSSIARAEVRNASWSSTIRTVGRMIAMVARPPPSNTVASPIRTTLGDQRRVNLALLHMTRSATARFTGKNTMLSAKRDSCQRAVRTRSAPTAILHV